jgi:hypothetical protein
MATKRVAPAASRPMTTQPLGDGRNQPIPMAPSPAKTPKRPSRRTAAPDGKAEIVRRSSLKKQRSQLDAIRKRKAGGGVAMVRKAR